MCDEKVSIEFGLANVMKRPRNSCPLQVAHKNSLELWTLDLPEIYSLLPSEIYDTSYQPIRQTVHTNMQRINFSSPISWSLTRISQRLSPFAINGYILHHCSFIEQMVSLVRIYPACMSCEALANLKCCLLGLKQCL